MTPSPNSPPLLAARGLAFQRNDDPVFGPLVFIGVRLRDDTIEIADFEPDPDHWDLVDDDPGG